MSIISGFEEQKRYINLENGDKKAVSEWTSTDTVDVSPNITNYETDLAHSDEWNDTYDDVSSQPTGLTDLITKITAFFNNVKFLKGGYGKVMQETGYSEANSYPILFAPNRASGLNKAFKHRDITFNPNFRTLKVADSDDEYTYGLNEIGATTIDIQEFSSDDHDLIGEIEITTSDILIADGWDIDNDNQSLRGTLNKKVSKPKVVQSSTINLNNYTATGSFILTGTNTFSNRPVTKPGQLEVIRWKESDNYYYVRQTYRVYDTGNYPDCTFTRIGKTKYPNDIHRGWNWYGWWSETCFRSGETWTIPQNAIYTGHVTNAGTELFVSIPLPKRMKFVSNISSHSSTVTLNVRQNGSYLEGGDYTYTWKNVWRNDNMLTVVFEKANHSAFTNATNNDDCSIYIVDSNFYITF